MCLLVVRPGPRATVQDLGRRGYRAWGVPEGGAFDRGALVVANALVGNPPEAAALELALFGGSFRAECDLAIALAGASMRAVIEAGSIRRSLRVPSTTTLAAGSTLTIGGAARGARLYLAVRGGWQTAPVLGSRSDETPLRAGDRLPAEPGTIPTRWFARDDGPESSGCPLRVLPGPDAGGYDLDDFGGQAFRVGAQSDRMGLRLEGPPIASAGDPDRLSAPVAPGAIQIAGGRPILLGVACGTMGGYPHVAHIIAADLDRLGQLRAGDKVAFRVVGLDEARRAHRERAERLRQLALRLRAMAADRGG